jgi:hypothetical protein
MPLDRTHLAPNELFMGWLLMCSSPHDECPAGRKGELTPICLVSGFDQTAARIQSYDVCVGTLDALCVR